MWFGISRGMSGRKTMTKTMFFQDQAEELAIY